jgi:hypothetical protein
MAQAVVALLDVLANLSATDSWHDFHDDIKDFREIILTNKETYMEGLPRGVTGLGNFNNEGHALSSVVKTKEGAPITNFGDFLINNNLCNTSVGLDGAYGIKQTPYSIETINDTKYSVETLVVAKGSSRGGETKAYMNANDFCEKLGIDDHSAIIVDATAVSLLSILKTGDETDKTIYYILTPEVVNDPAQKTLISDKIFIPNKKGVRLVPCVSNVPPSINYNYSYDKKINSGELLKSESTNPYDKFFSAYNFQLSEMQQIKKGKKIDYTTNLLIKSNDARLPVPENVPDSKSKNNITFLTSLLLGALKLLGTKKDTAQNKFLFNTKLQQKRSGDWLQVLACLIVKSRKIKTYTQSGPATENIEKTISKTYFVTHDRVALSFALLLGVECIYTHTKTKSCYVFKLSSPEAEAAAKIRFLQTKKTELDEISRKVIDAQAYFNSTQKTQLVIYNKFREQNITIMYTGQITNTISDYTKSNDLSSKKSDPFDSTEFTKFTCKVFELCLLYQYLLLNFPDLSLYKTEGMFVFQTKISPLINKFYNNETDQYNPGNDDEFTSLKNEINEVILNYKNLMASISTLETSLNKYVTKEKPFQLKINMETTLNNFQKTPNRKLASGWSWDNTQGNSRMWESFKDLIGSTSYKSDKNIFLYTITSLPDDIKGKLCTIYSFIKDKITQNPAPKILEKIGRAPAPTEITSEPRLTKFKVVTLGFIAEVFLTFGFAVNSTVKTVVDRETAYNNFIKTMVGDSKTVMVNGTPVKIEAFEEGSITSENSEATKINILAQNAPENYVRQNRIINYKTEVDPTPSVDTGRSIEDSEVVGKLADELTKKLEQANEVIENAKEEAAPVLQPEGDVPQGDVAEEDVVSQQDEAMAKTHKFSRENLDDDEEFNREKKSAITQVLSGTEPAAQDVVISDIVEDLKSSIGEKKAIEDELSGQQQPVVSDEKIRDPIVTTTLINNADLTIRKGSKLLGADFEVNVKDATYVLLNALLDYKNSGADISRLGKIINPILDRFHEDYDDAENLSSSDTSTVVQTDSESEASLQRERIDPSPSLFGRIMGYKKRSELAGHDSLRDLTPPSTTSSRRILRIGTDTLHRLPPPTRGGMVGGDGSQSTFEEKRALFEDFFKTVGLSQTEGEEPSQTSGDINIITDFNYLFHPLLPIYMISESLNEIVENDDIDESLDYEYYQQYFNFLNVVRENLTKMYWSGNIIDSANAYLISTCLREFFFYGDVYSMTDGQKGGRIDFRESPTVSQIDQKPEEDDTLVDVGKGKEPEPDHEFEIDHDPIPGQEEEIQVKLQEGEPILKELSYCEQVLGLTKSEFLPVSLVTGILSGNISGTTIRSKEEIYQGEKMLKSELFKKFIKDVNMVSIFRESLDSLEPISSFKRKCFVFLLETGNAITLDRGGTLIEIPDESLTNPFHPDRITLREIQASAAEARRASNSLGGSKKNRAKKRNYKTKRHGKTKRRSTRNHRKYKVKRNTKRN